MTWLIRFGVSMEKQLLERFDRILQKEGYTSRSEAIRDLIRKNIVEGEWEHGETVAGSIMLVYNHHQRELLEKIMDIQHDFHDVIISTQHVHMDEDNCLEIIVVKGKVEKIKNIYNALTALKGVKHTSLSRATTGKKI
ncbi:MAG TPA: nickel-responsive transcriptional regulator NikR [bacterium]|nr:nickel-responsive transcriptional regulator NikR [bacterium]